MSTYTITVKAHTTRDAVDIAKRRARDDGYAVVDAAARVIHVEPPSEGRPGLYSVELGVMRQ